MLLQNRHTVRPVHKLRVKQFALIAMDGMYAGFAGAKACHEKIRINRGTLRFLANKSFSSRCGSPRSIFECRHPCHKYENQPSRYHTGVAIPHAGRGWDYRSGGYDLDWVQNW